MRRLGGAWAEQRDALVTQSLEALPTLCDGSPGVGAEAQLWRGLVALCLLEEQRALELTHAKTPASGPVQYCQNHDDGGTLATVHCLDCEPEVGRWALCATCDDCPHPGLRNSVHAPAGCAEDGGLGRG